PGISTCHNIKVREQGDRLFISAHCLCAPTTPVGEAHRAAARVEEKLHAALPSLERVLVHTEPARA
ncbi:MAG: cation transporter, partial [Armatimonadetes bacterium]|nr:cation transporter [Armatimonadota bacterium]